MEKENYTSEDIILEFTNKLLYGSDIDLEEYCQKYPLLKENLQRRYHILRLIEEGFKEETWAGRKIGEYIIVEEIGRGGMGVVFLAIQSSLNRYVALKILPFELTFDSKTIRRFQNEAKIIAKFNHPNIVPVLSRGEYEGVHYIVMAFIPGLPLNKIIYCLKHLSKSASEIKASEIKDIISRHLDFVRFNFDLNGIGIPESIIIRRDHSFWQKPYFEFILTICREVADALDYAHKNYIYHGDLKPSNIILTLEGVPMILDFGLAKDMKVITTTQSKEFAGTVAYASPEQIKNNIINEKTDIWSLGVTLYELISLNHPFHGETASETLGKIMNSEPLLLRKYNKKIPKEIEAIIFKCLEKNPDRRYSSMAMLEEDIGSFLESKPVKARPVKIIGRLLKWIKRRTLISFLASLLILLGLISSFIFIDKKINEQMNNGNVFYKQGNYDNALDRYSKAMALLKIMPFSKHRQKIIFSELGDVWLSKGAYETAISYYKKALELDPNYSPAISGLGDTYLEKGFYDEAIKFYKSGIELAPNDRYNYYMIGKALVSKGLLDEAIENYLIAIRLAPDDLDTVREIASILNKKGLYKDDEIRKYLKGKNFNSEQIKSVLLVLRKSAQ